LEAEISGSQAVRYVHDDGFYIYRKFCEVFWPPTQIANQHPNFSEQRGAKNYYKSILSSSFISFNTMSETIAATSSRNQPEAVFVEKQIHASSITGSSSFEKIVSACTGAIITMSFSK